MRNGTRARRSSSSELPRAGSENGGTAARRPRVLVVYKKSAYQTNVKERKNPRFIELLAKKDTSVTRLVEAHEAHVETLDEARAALDELGARASFRFRGDEGLVEEVDLVATVGGDGTLLWASHWVGAGIPIVAINSAPLDSVGHFCAGAKGRVKETLEAALAGRLEECRLSRMRLAIDGEEVSKRVLNDVLFTHASPAATSRYVLSHVSDGERDTEEHKSSGVWIGPAAGSTAAQLSAGGRVLPARSKRLQWVVREPYVPRTGAYRLVRGLVEPEQRLEILSKMREGRVFVDGPHHVREVGMGQVVTLSRSDESLTLLGYPRAADSSSSA